MDTPKNTITKENNEVPARLQSLNIASLDLLETLKPFLDRLAPVTRQEPLSDSAQPGSIPSSTAFGGALSEVEDRIRHIQRLVLDANSTLEL